MTPQPSAEPIRVLLIDDHTLFREGLARLLDREPGFRMAAHCATAEEGLAVLDRTPVDVVLLDFDLDGSPCSGFLPTARHGGFHGRTLIVTAGVGARNASQLLADGASGVFLKHRPAELLVDCIRRVARGETWIDEPRPPVNRPPVNKPAVRTLSARERKALRLVFEGFTNKEIASRLAISETAVKWTLQRLFGKTGARSRSQLIRVAMQLYLEEL